MSQATQNVDPGEVDQFAAKSGEWWNVSGPFRMLHRIGPVRLAYIRDTAVAHFDFGTDKRRPLTGCTCLDVGCGGGLTSEPLSRLGGAITAIDPAPENIEAAHQHARESSLAINYRTATAEDLVLEGQQFDLVVCLEVIEHVPDPAAFTNMLATLVRPGGLLIMSTINRTPKSYALAIVGAEYILGWVPRGTHEWRKFVTTGELKEYCTHAGLTGFASSGVIYDPFADVWKSSTDTDVNYMAHASKPRAPGS